MLSVLLFPLFGMLIRGDAARLVDPELVRARPQGEL